MTQSMHQIVSTRADHLLHQFHTAANPPAVNLPWDLLQVNARVWGGSLVTDVEGSSAFFIHPTNPTLSSVWAVPSYGSYRDAYLRFIKQAYGLANPSIPGGLDVDHLRAKSTAAAGQFIRLEVVDKSANRSGGGIEKRQTKSPVTKGRIARGHTPGSMSFLVVLKLAGVLSPTVRSSATWQARRDAALTYLTSRGWNRDTVAEALDTLEEMADAR
ncbi:hypothetical protein [Vannielia litorea]|uniref:Uncharacterized protein n=1 Tax=Vannielia litorea TaxID=1217970 RepID=A0A1N6H5E7_9RHOB|nr:hypothetical protein [Vannielia litorea]SIO14979.1 hypothetical protein SAMN05444002_3093 [Vannielia litorea]